MITWKKVNEIPVSDGQYLVHCSASNFDSDWIDIARYDEGKWHKFGSPISHQNRVDAWAEINYPT